MSGIFGLRDLIGGFMSLDCGFNSGYIVGLSEFVICGNGFDLLSSF